MTGDNTSAEGELNFTAKIVRYHGMRQLPDGQTWGWPAGASTYPFLSFHDQPYDDMSLCFEDRDGKKGLNRFYGRSVDAIEHGKRMTVYLNLDATDMEAASPARRRARTISGRITGSTSRASRGITYSKRCATSALRKADPRNANSSKSEKSNDTRQ